MPADYLISSKFNEFLDASHRGAIRSTRMSTYAIFAAPNTPNLSASSFFVTGFRPAAQSPNSAAKLSKSTIPIFFELHMLQRTDINSGFINVKVEGLYVVLYAKVCRASAYAGRTRIIAIQTRGRAAER
jgi:hypothetical protein